MSPKTRLPSSWLRECQEWQERERLSLRALGKRLAEAAGKSAAFDAPSLSRYLKGESASEEITRAFALARTVPAPARLHGDQDVQEWCDLGYRLQRESPDRFQRELAALRAVVEALEAHSNR